MKLRNWGTILSSFLQDAHVLEKLVEASFGGEDSEAIAHELLCCYGTAGKAVIQLNSESSEALCINSRLAKLFDAIHQLNLNVLYKRISDEPFPNCNSNILGFFKEQFPMRETYIAQFFFFCGNKFVGSGTPVTGTVNYVELLRREVLSEALGRNATKILPVVGLPHGVTNVNDRVNCFLEDLGMASVLLEISTESAIFA